MTILCIVVISIYSQGSNGSEDNTFIGNDTNGTTGADAGATSSIAGQTKGKYVYNGMTTGDMTDESKMLIYEPYETPYTNNSVDRDRDRDRERDSEFDHENSNGGHGHGHGRQGQHRSRYSFDNTPARLSITDDNIGVNNITHSMDKTPDIMD